MPKVRFLSEFKNSDDGFTIVIHKAGSVADVSDSCAIGAFSVGAAELIDSEGKSQSEAPKNKAKGASPKNKEQ